MRFTEWLPVARPMLGRYRSLPSVAPRLPIGDRGRWAPREHFAGIHV